MPKSSDVFTHGDEKRHLHGQADKKRLSAKDVVILTLMHRDQEKLDKALAGASNYSLRRALSVLKKDGNPVDGLVSYCKHHRHFDPSNPSKRGVAQPRPGESRIYKAFKNTLGGGKYIKIPIDGTDLGQHARIKVRFFKDHLEAGPVTSS